MKELLNMLNNEQREAVECLRGPLLVLAGAGSGKTRVVTLRIVNLLENEVPAHSILGLTFTNKAAQEMRERVNKLTQAQVLICTFHSLGVRLLRESIHALDYSRDFMIYDEQDIEKLLKLCLEELHIADRKFEIKTFRQMISGAKNELLSPLEATPPDSGKDEAQYFTQVYTLYQNKLKEYNAVDFDDLLFLPVRLFREHPDILNTYQVRWQYVLIDEYQDTNTAQYELVRMLVSLTKNICVVGDPDQSIYSWRGAKIKNILNFERDYAGAKVVRLEQNYRSHTHILNGANALIKYNDNRFEKSLWSDLGPGEKIKIFGADTERVEAEFVIRQVYQHHSKDNVPLSEAVIFYRTNFQSRPFEDILLANRIPYVIVGGISFYQRREIKDVLAFLRMVHSGTDYVSFMRTINLPKRGMGETTVEKIRSAAALSNLSIFAYCLAYVNEDPLKITVKLTGKQKENLKDYVRIIQALKIEEAKGSIRSLIVETLNLTRYLDVLKEEKETFDDRKGNVEELVAKAAEWESINENGGSLSSFLEELSLKSTLDEADTEQDRLNLMTIHNGKGLEYNLTFMVGMEEDLFPHANSRGSKEGLEEERRLCYVGMTRARKWLYMSYSKLRYLWGNSREMRPSRFFKEIPTEHLEKVTYQRGGTSRTAPPPRPKPTLEYAEDFIDDIDQTKDQIVKPPAAVNLNRTFGLAAAESLNMGDAVFHNEFGVGIIQRAYQGGAGLTYEVLFSKDHSRRNLVAKHAPLTKL